jgi:hypothetical protein
MELRPSDVVSCLHGMSGYPPLARKHRVVGAAVCRVDKETLCPSEFMHGENRGVKGETQRVHGSVIFRSRRAADMECNVSDRHHRWVEWLIVHLPIAMSHA